MPDEQSIRTLSSGIALPYLNRGPHTELQELTAEDAPPSAFPLIGRLLLRPHQPNSIFTLHTLFVGLLLFLCMIVAITGAVPTRRYGHDIFFLLDNGWRTLNGQRPHVDYTSAWGPVTFLIVALGLKISRYTVDGIGYASAILGFVVGGWAYLLTAKRTNGVLRVLCGLFLALLTMAPYPLGRPPFESSHAMVYNRYGYALLGIILVGSFLPPTATAPWKDWLRHISSGLAAGILLFLKVSFFPIALIFLCASFLTEDRRMLRLLGLAIGFLIVGLPILIYLRFNVSDMLSDLTMAAGARFTVSSPLSVMVWNAKIHADRLITVICLGIVAALPSIFRPSWRAACFPVLAALIYGSDIVLLSSNNQEEALPLAAIFALVICATVTARPASTSQSRYEILYRASVTLFAAALFLPYFLLDLSGIFYGAWSKARPSSGALHFTAPRLAPLLLYDAEFHGSNGREYTTYVNDGVALLQRRSAASDTIATLDMTNPFPYALNRRPPSGGLAAASYNYTISDAHRPSADHYFGNADIVMVPKRPALNSSFFAGFYALYAEGLRAKFSLAAETDWWQLYKRK